MTRASIQTIDNHIYYIGDVLQVTYKYRTRYKKNNNRKIIGKLIEINSEKETLVFFARRNVSNRFVTLKLNDIIKIELVKEFKLNTKFINNYFIQKEKKGINRRYHLKKHRLKVASLLANIIKEDRTLVNNN